MKMKSQNENEISEWKRDPRMKMKSQNKNEIPEWKWNPRMKTKFQNENEIPDFQPCTPDFQNQIFPFCGKTEIL